MSTVRRFGAVAMAVLALTLAACATSTVKPTGVVTGFVDACVALQVPTSKPLHVKVVLYLGQTLLASETVRSGATYRFVVAPGSYRVAAWRSEDVVVRTGQTVTVNFPDICK